MKDVTSLTLALEPADREHLLTHLRAVGYTVREEAEAAVAVGPDVSLRITPVGGDRRGVTEVELSLQSIPASGSEQRFGATQVSLARARGMLRFGATKAGTR